MKHPRTVTGNHQVDLAVARGDGRIVAVEVKLAPRKLARRLAKRRSGRHTWRAMKARRVATAAIAFSTALVIAAGSGAGSSMDAGTRERAADCRETPVSPAPPNAWMGTLSTHWRRRGTLWMGYTRADDAFVARATGQKIPWFRAKGSPWGRLRVSGLRLDGDAPPLKAQIPVSYPFREGFQSSALTFSTPGCWQIVARVGLTARFVFVVQVEAE
ncbi:MAG: hypothetical protein MSC30_15055 [Gaiellaceae bacterium MAG52_C11]|nr:hypothetical protein [Candidatus Gaiellasilicea maunaloa]